MDRSTMDMKKKKRVTLISSNGRVFHGVNLAMLSQCRVIKDRVEKAMHQKEEEEGCCDDDDDIITLRVPEITGRILAMVLDYCHCSSSTNGKEENLRIWEARLAEEVGLSTLAHLILAANYLDMRELVVLAEDVMSGTGRTQSEIFKIFNSKLDTKEEEVSRQLLADSWFANSGPDRMDRYDGIASILSRLAESS